MKSFNSCLYEARVYHRRYVRKPYWFRRRMFLFCLDLEELPQLERSLKLFGWKRPRPFRFRDADHFGWLQHRAAPGWPHGPEEAAAERRARELRASADSNAEHPGNLTLGRVRAHLAARGQAAAGARVLLVTSVRVLGYVFNPVSFYYCYDADGALRAVLTEVNNTFLEQKPYLLPVGASESDSASRSEVAAESVAPKWFYVSPFIRQKTDFYLRFRAPERVLNVRIDTQVRGRTILKAILHGTRVPLSDGALLRMFARYPFVTVQVIVLIHYYAIKLWLRKVPFFGKAESDSELRVAFEPAPSEECDPPKFPEAPARETPAQIG